MGFATDFQGALSSFCVVFVAYVVIDDTNVIETAKHSGDDFKDVGSQM